MAKSDDETIDDLKETRDNILELMKAVTSKPKPTYNIDGQNVEWKEYMEMLTEQFKNINSLIVTLDPFEEEVVWYPGS